MRLLMDWLTCMHTLRQKEAMASKSAVPLHIYNPWPQEHVTSPSGACWQLPGLLLRGNAWQTVYAGWLVP